MFGKLNDNYMMGVIRYFVLCWTWLHWKGQPFENDCELQFFIRSDRSL